MRGYQEDELKKSTSADDLQLYKAAPHTASPPPGSVRGKRHPRAKSFVTTEPKKREDHHAVGSFNQEDSSSSSSPQRVGSMTERSFVGKRSVRTRSIQPVGRMAPLAPLREATGSVTAREVPRTSNLDSRVPTGMCQVKRTPTPPE